MTKTRADVVAPHRNGRGKGQEAVAESLRQAIMANELAPGQRLIEADLCEEYGTSRGTLRAALTSLVAEGLVEHIANRGARVRVVGLDEALEIVDVRLALEILCIRRAIPRLTDDHLARLRRFAEELTSRAAEHDITGYADTTHAVFRFYVDIAGNGVAQETLERLRDRLSRHRLRLTYRPGRAEVSLPYWLSLIDALCGRDIDAAVQALEDHAGNIRQSMITLSR
ncbi:MAG: GntR family transcriptional regulator [Hyphomicrobiaceae bacterium]